MASLAVPAMAMAIALPIIRVHGVPQSSPEFNVVAFEATITPAALETGNLYRRALDRFEGAEGRIGNSRVPNAAGRKWLDDNAETLAIVLEASRRGACVLDDPREVTDWTRLHNGIPLVQLVIQSGRLLESEGKLDVALDRYFAAHLGRFATGQQLPVVRQSNNASKGVKLVFAELLAWAAQKDQTPERIRGAIGRLQQADFDLLKLEDRLKIEYVVARRYATGRFAGLAGAVRSHEQ